MVRLSIDDLGFWIDDWGWEKNDEKRVKSGGFPVSQKSTTLALPNP
jgi:hypothetical protein